MEEFEEEVVNLGICKMILTVSMDGWDLYYQMHLSGTSTSPSLVMNERLLVMMKMVNKKKEWE